MLNPDRLFPADEKSRALARNLFSSVEKLPILSPHGHTQAEWFVEDHSFADPATLLIVPDHYIYRMLYSQRVLGMEDLGLKEGKPKDPRRLWRTFASHYHLFRGTPTGLWLDYEFQTLFGLEDRLNAETADRYFDSISEKLQSPEFRPRALYKQFNIEVLSTTDGATSTLEAHRTLKESGWNGRILPTFRPDAVVDPDFAGFSDNLDKLGQLYAEDTWQWNGYCAALRQARRHFQSLGGTATDHGHPTVNTAQLNASAATALFQRVRAGNASFEDHELFRAQMLTEMARMSTEDGLVMQIHPGSFRNHNAALHAAWGRDIGADIPVAMDYVHALKPLLDQFGNDERLTIILFTLDETTYSRELAPLAGHYPCLLLGPPWWFNDSPEGMQRFRKSATETAGFYNTVGFNDDTRAFLSIPARHDVARRVDCAFLAELVIAGRLHEDEAFDLAYQLTNGLVRKAYKLGRSEHNAY